MAKKATTTGAKPKAKKRTVKADVGGVQIKLKAKGKKTKKAKSKATNAADALARFAENPIVADLIAIGATAAVAAIASGLSAKSGKTSTRAVKDAGKAAAAAIGARLVEEFKAVKDSANAAAKKRDA